MKNCLVERLESALKDFALTPSGARHDKIKGLARLSRNAGLDRYDGELKAKQAYLEATGGRLTDDQEADLERTFASTYDEIESTPVYSHRENLSGLIRRTAEARRVWREAQEAHSLFAEKVDKAEAKGNAVEAIFIHADKSGRIWYGDSIQEDHWFAPCDGDWHNGTYLSTCTFGEAKNERGNRSREKANIQEICAMLLEIDAPLNGEEITDQAAKAEAIYQDTMAIIEALGVNPTTITFSGNKSYHCLFRLSTPITVAEFDAHKDELKKAYAVIGVDPAVVSPGRCTRWPKESKEGQRLIYLDAEAEISFAEYCEAVERLARQIGGDGLAEIEEECKDEDARPIIKVTTDKGEKWVENPVDLAPFIRSCGFFTREDPANPLADRTLWRKEGHIFRQCTTQSAYEILMDEMKKRFGDDYAAIFGRKYGQSLMNDKLICYLGIKAELNEAKDSKEAVYIPFANGMAHITSGGVSIDSGAIFDVRADAPSRNREYKDDGVKGEYEIFLERACGCEESHPLWQERKKSFMTLLGYLISRKKEPVNYLCVITEESMLDDDGGTGKSLIMGTAKYFRRRYVRECKNDRDSDSRRFLMSGVTTDIDYIQFDDIRANFKFEDYFTYSTDDWTIELKGRNERRIIPLEYAPKMVFGSNSYPRGENGSYDRRYRIFELSTHYGAACKPYDEFGHTLFDEWNKEEWARFDAFICQCVQAYLRDGLIQCKSETMAEKKLMANVPEELREFFEYYIEENENIYNKTVDVFGNFNSWYFRTYHQNYKAISQKYFMTALRKWASAKKKKMWTGPHRIKGKLERCVCVGSNAEICGNDESSKEEMPF